MIDFISNRAEPLIFTLSPLGEMTDANFSDALFEKRNLLVEVVLVVLVDVVEVDARSDAENSSLSEPYYGVFTHL